MIHRALALIAFVIAGSLPACHGTPPPSPDAESVRWATYTDETVGFSLDYPDVYTVTGQSGSVRMRHDGYPVISIALETEQGARRRGLWSKHDPVGEIELGGRDGKRYVYHHYDGPFSMRTVSYVVEHDGKYLGLEFRTALDQPDAVQRHILDSFRFD